MANYEDRVLKLAELINTAVRKEQRLVLVVGNGYNYLPIFRRDDIVDYYILKHVLEPKGIVPSSELVQLKRKVRGSFRFQAFFRQLLTKYQTEIGLYRPSVGEEERDSQVWRMYESWRLSSRRRSQVTRVEYGNIAYLLRKLAIDAIITTNYDVMLETTSRICGRKLVRNPCWQPSLWRFDGYYGKRLNAEAPDYWKIHGDLSYYAWPRDSRRLCDCVCRAPYRERKLPYSRTVGMETVRSGHYHDYGNFDRLTFKLEIDATKKYLRRVERGQRNVGVILALGLKGDYNPSDPMSSGSEELAKPLVRLAKAGLPVFSILRSNRRIGPNHTYLWRELNAIGNAIQPEAPWRRGLKKDSVGLILWEVLTKVRQFDDFKIFQDRWIDGLVDL